MRMTGVAVAEQEVSIDHMAQATAIESTNRSMSYDSSLLATLISLQAKAETVHLAVRQMDVSFRFILRKGNYPYSS